jgi:hypothetical protein
VPCSMQYVDTHMSNTQAHCCCWVMLIIMYMFHYTSGSYLRPRAWCWFVILVLASGSGSLGREPGAGGSVSEIQNPKLQTNSRGCLSNQQGQLQLHAHTPTLTCPQKEYTKESKSSVFERVQGGQGQGEYRRCLPAPPPLLVRRYILFLLLEARFIHLSCVSRFVFYGTKTTAIHTPSACCVHEYPHNTPHYPGIGIVCPSVSPAFCS